MKYFIIGVIFALVLLTDGLGLAIIVAILCDLIEKVYKINSLFVKYINHTKNGENNRGGLNSGRNKNDS